MSILSTFSSVSANAFKRITESVGKFALQFNKLNEVNAPTGIMTYGHNLQLSDDGNTMLVGTSGLSGFTKYADGTWERNMAYVEVFKKNGSNWTKIQTFPYEIQTSVNISNNYVALSGDGKTIARTYNTVTTSQGVSNGGWTFTIYTHSNKIEFYKFNGTSFVLDSNIEIINNTGTIWHSYLKLNYDGTLAITYSGGFFSIYQLSSGTWTKKFDSNSVTAWEYSSGIRFSDRHTLTATRNFETIACFSSKTSVDIYKKNSSGWTVFQTISVALTNTSRGDRLQSVNLSDDGNTLLISYIEEATSNPNNICEVYTSSGSTYTKKQTISIPGWYTTYPYYYINFGQFADGQGTLISGDASKILFHSGKCAKVYVNENGKYVYDLEFSVETEVTQDGEYLYSTYQLGGQGAASKNFGTLVFGDSGLKIDETTFGRILTYLSNE